MNNIATEKEIEDWGVSHWDELKKHICSYVKHLPPDCQILDVIENEKRIWLYKSIEIFLGTVEVRRIGITKEVPGWNISLWEWVSNVDELDTELCVTETIEAISSKDAAIHATLIALKIFLMNNGEPNE